MGLFDTIERLNTADEQPVTPKPQAQHLPIQPVTATTAPKAAAQDHHQTAAEDSGPDTWRPSPAEIAERRRILNRPPERLSFLAPCPVCQGRAFLHIEGGGFVCRTCTPGLFGYPVEATGPDRQAPAMDADLSPAGEGDDAATDPLPAVNHQADELRAIFVAAWPWIKENKAALLAAGWTISSLARRSKFRWPCGPWGLAWLPVWTKPGLTVTIGHRGEVVFTFPSSGRTITQSAHPPQGTKKQKNREVIP